MPAVTPLPRPRPQCSKDISCRHHPGFECFGPSASHCQRRYTPTQDQGRTPCYPRPYLHRLASTTHPSKSWQLQRGRDAQTEMLGCRELCRTARPDRRSERQKPRRNRGRGIRRRHCQLEPCRRRAGSLRCLNNRYHQLQRPWLPSLPTVRSIERINRAVERCDKDAAFIERHTSVHNTTAIHHGTTTIDLGVEGPKQLTFACVDGIDH